MHWAYGWPPAVLVLSAVATGTLSERHSNGTYKSRSVNGLDPGPLGSQQVLLAFTTT
jgi:hypothetical protein